MTITSATEYRKNKIWTLELPSWLDEAKTKHPVFSFRSPPPKSLVPLLSILDMKIDPESAEEDKDKMKEEVRKKVITKMKDDMDSLERLTEALEKIIIICSVEPKIVADADYVEGSIPISEVELNDQLAILDAVMDRLESTEEQKNFRKPSSN